MDAQGAGEEQPGDGCAGGRRGAARGWMRRGVRQVGGSTRRSSPSTHPAAAWCTLPIPSPRGPCQALYSPPHAGPSIAPPPRRGACLPVFPVECQGYRCLHRQRAQARLVQLHQLPADFACTKQARARGGGGVLLGPSAGMAALHPQPPTLFSSPHSPHPHSCTPPRALLIAAPFSPHPPQGAAVQAPPALLIAAPFRIPRKAQQSTPPQPASLLSKYSLTAPAAAALYAATPTPARPAAQHRRAARGSAHLGAGL